MTATPSASGSHSQSPLVERRTSGRAGGGGGGGMITAVLALLCVVLAIGCIALYSGRQTMKDEVARAGVEKTRIEADLKLKNDQLTTANSRLNQISTQLGQSVMISELPAAVRGSTKVESLRKIEALAGGATPVVSGPAPAAGDAAAWLERIAQQVNRGNIDTTKGPADAARTETYKGVQTVLARVGAFNKPVTGTQKDTLDAVLAFQKANGLKADGIIGKGTWGKVREKFEIAMARR